MPCADFVAVICISALKCLRDFRRWLFICTKATTMIIDERGRGCRITNARWKIDPTDHLSGWKAPPPSIASGVSVISSLQRKHSGSGRGEYYRQMITRGLRID